MALSLDFPWRGLTIKGAYVRLDEVRGGKRMVRPGPQKDATGLWQATACFYASRQAADEHPPILVLEVTIPYDAEKPPLPLLYAMLKTSPELAGASDV